MVDIVMADEEFEDWQALLSLLQDAFAYMEARIDPPSSLRLLNTKTIIDKAREETLLLAWEGSRLVGCCFLKDMDGKIYLGKLAIDPQTQKSGVGGLLVEFAKTVTKSRNRKIIELQSRVELTEVHEFFRRHGFRQTGTTAHKGYDRPTSITMQLEL
ncbi:GNAT family N-acetyltransferase [uncultured Sneathiella sp.]|uniref:GNAT family N-acetyltransferase n=1 Tax=uncultured Sneathiella sp. TaxID=879315 RepID=UPI0030EDC397|tara:strand:- start:9343 stop:9813 length:471 start_codon:yes stop_codon:yes gene_type:complete